MMFKRKKKDLWYSRQVDEMWRKINAGIEEERRGGTEAGHEDQRKK